MEKWSFQRIRKVMPQIALRGMAGNELGRARISMMVRSLSSNTRPDTLVQDRTLQPHVFSCIARRDIASGCQLGAGTGPRIGDARGKNSAGQPLADARSFDASPASNCVQDVKSTGLVMNLQAPSHQSCGSRSTGGLRVLGIQVNLP
jgi:hypothetical protein